MKLVSKLFLKLPDLVIAWGIIAGLVLLGFVVSTILLYITFWGFGWDFSMKIAVGFYAFWILLNGGVVGNK